MMKVAMPQWQGRISPVFDAASRLLLIDMENNIQTGRMVLKMPPEDALSRAQRLEWLGVDTLICGAISSAMATAIVSAGIEIFACACGPVDGVFKAFLENRLANPNFLLPGCNQPRRYDHV